MATINAVFEILNEFLNELHETFSEEQQIKDVIDIMQKYTDDEKNSFYQNFSSQIKTNGKLIASNNPKLFKKGKIEFFDQIKLHKIWKKDFGKKTRDAIWKYINTLNIICTTVDSIPKDLLMNIEKMAHECASKLSQNKEGNIENQEDTSSDGPNLQNLENIMQNIDMDALMSGMQNILGKNMNLK